MISRREALAGAMALGGAGPAAATPNRSVRLIIPVSAGSVSDIVGRLLAEQLASRWSLPVVVDNRPGAGGAIGVEAATRAPADGHTLLLGSSGPIAILPAVSRRLAYDPLRDLLPLARIAEFPLVVLASPGSGLRSLGDLLQRARRGGEPLHYAGGMWAPRSTWPARCWRRRAACA